MASTALAEARVLAADDSPTVRQSLRLTLSTIGITRVDVASSVGETRRRLKNGNYDVVLCDYDFGGGMNGQELLEELRRTGELPLSTIWFMITAEASYERVVAVAEVGPDDYLLKPFTGARLSDRLRNAWDRKQALKPLYEKIADDDINGAIQIARELMPRADASYRNDLLRLLSSLLLEAGRLDEARTLYEEILNKRVVPWARLGLAKVFNRQGRKEQANTLLNTAISEHANYVDAYEELAHSYLAEGRLEDAMGVFDQCLTISPNNVSRLQKAGNLANMLGQSDKARALLEKAVACGGNSSALAPETVLQLALAAKRGGVAADADKYLRTLVDVARRDGGVNSQVVGILAAAIFGGKADELNKIEPFLHHPEFTLELAVNLIMTADLVCPPTVEGERPAPGIPPWRWLQALAQRFITTRQTSGVLESAANLRPAWKDFIQRIGQDVIDLNNRGVQLMMRNAVSESVGLLVEAAERTLNSRLMLSAAHALNRYLQSGTVEASEKRRLLHLADQFLARLHGSIGHDVLFKLREDLGLNK
ncbi:hypothetical protein JCM19000A_36370 [Silvimonas sp. JCM 19000]